ncbi:hypothetical protein CTAYLR_008580 [Chrysophaeum taylorii]|uniref:RNA-binding S4 domain-containing protein n=1 Tax=Chrysophaeum taylorii TaxID=2483200 RepID=A0AAD7XPV0_9STRA|nr:hypothetical protein CTAYLR_008580 [Chrysophaeum taylorii]
MRWCLITKVVAAMSSHSVRLDKFLADAGVASRSMSAGLVRSGRVRVDGTVVRAAARKISPSSSRVELDGNGITELPVLLAYNKPLDVVSTMRDNHGRADLSRVVPASWRGKFHPVGRLDADTTGLLLFSSRGDLTQRLLHPKHAVEKEYVADCEDARGCCEEDAVPTPRRCWRSNDAGMVSCDYGSS